MTQPPSGSTPQQEPRVPEDPPVVDDVTFDTGMYNRVTDVPEPPDAP